MVQDQSHTGGPSSAPRPSRHSAGKACALDLAILLRVPRGNLRSARRANNLFCTLLHRLRPRTGAQTCSRPLPTTDFAGMLPLYMLKCYAHIRPYICVRVKCVSTFFTLSSSFVSARARVFSTCSITIQLQFSYMFLQRLLLVVARVSLAVLRAAFSF